MNNFEYRQLLPDAFAPEARVWIYQCNRRFSLSEALQIEELLTEFTGNWLSHGAAVKGYANLFFGQFIVLMADETDTGVSGCSTDSSVRLVKQMEAQFNVSLFDRQLLAFVIKDSIQVLPLSQLAYATGNQFIHADTIYFNNLVQTKAALEQNWMIPVKASWLSKRFTLTSTPL